MEGKHAKEMITRTKEAPEPAAPRTLMEMASFALARGDGLDVIERLMDLNDRNEKAKAKREYHDSMAEFKAKLPRVMKDRQVKFKTQKGTTEYRHATLGAVVEVVTPEMAKYGLSHSWKPSQEKDRIIVECVITHRAGHSESISLSAPADTSGTKNAIQSMASTITYLERYTLMAITGLAAADQDDDGVASKAVGPITEEQEGNIESMRTMLIKGKKIKDNMEFQARLEKSCGVKSLDELTEESANKLISALRNLA